MKQIHVWPNHIAIPDADLVLWRSASEPLAATLGRLSRMGYDATSSNVEVHGDIAQ
jgi:hypothetical protein